MNMRSKIMLVLLSLAFVCGNVFAGEETAGDYMSSIGTKFGRGLGNILQSPGEIGCGVHSEIQKRQAVGAVTGLGVGLAWFLRRALVGVDETVTFVIPMDPTLPPPCWSR